MRWYGPEKMTNKDEPFLLESVDIASLADNVPGAYIYRYVREPGGKTRFLYISAGVEAIRGVTAAEVMRDAGVLERQVDPAEMAGVQRAMAASAQNQADLVADLRIRRPDGQWRWVRVRSKPHLSDDGAIVWDGVTTDVTSQKEIEAAFHFNQSRLAITLDNMIEGYQVIDFGFNCVYANASAARQGQKTVDELIGRPMTALYPGIEQTPLYSELQRCMTERTSHRMENRFDYPDGRSAIFEVSIEPVPEGLLILSFDITERKKLEAQLLQSQKMEAVGQLAGGVAHDFNNMLTVILGYIDLLIPVSDQTIRHALEQIRTAGERAAGLTRQLLAFSRQQVMEMQVVDVNAVVLDTKKLIGRIIGEDIDVAAFLNPALSRVRVDPGQLSQILMNLAVNARDAMPKGGKLTIETANTELDDGYLKSRSADVAPGNYVMVAVSDNGIGMPPETVEHIFEPFFTTKPAGKGTGLGLAVVHGIIKQCGGHVAVYSEPDIGTTFRIYLPAIDDSPNQPAAAGDATSRGSETVVLVEDDAGVRDLTAVVLRKYGYTVIAASGAKEALEIMAARGWKADLVITDVVMPDMSGRVLVDLLRLRHPGQKVLFLSGYTDDAIVRHGVLHADVAFLQKPFTGTALASKVREVLESDQS
jgi:two-component system, cell cycle sensor histidine kinase and response regulator CckA